MRLSVFSLLVFCSSLAFGQDPTIPSQAILSRLRTGSATEDQAPQKPVIPIFKLKAIVFQNDDHGNAIVEVDGRRVYIQLNRDKVVSSRGIDSTSKSREGIQVGESLYRLVDFSARTILLSNGTQEVLVQ